MCLILFAHRIHPDFPLVLAANRDEFLDRPTAPIAFRDDRRMTLGGTDLVAGGTWLAVSRSGRFSAVTNVREPAFHVEGASSRGFLVSDYLAGDHSPEDYALRLDSEGMNGFNLLLGSPASLVYATNRGGPPGRPVPSVSPVPPGIHGLSNASLDTPWPKVVRGCQGLRSVIESGEFRLESLFDLLADETQAPENELPETGVGPDLERALSAARIRLPRYGTRSSTVLVVSSDGHATMAERTWPRRGGVPEFRHFRLRIEDPVAHP